MARDIEAEGLDPELKRLGELVKKTGIEAQRQGNIGASVTKYGQTRGTYDKRLRELRLEGITAPKAEPTKLGTWEEESERLGVSDVAKARLSAEKIKEQFIDEDPFGEAYERTRVGIEAFLGKQAGLEQRQLRAGLAHMGEGVSAIKRFQITQAAATETAYRYLGAERELGTLQMQVAEKKLSAIEKYTSLILGVAGAQRGMFATYWQTLLAERGNGVVTIGGGTGTDVFGAKQKREEEKAARRGKGTAYLGTPAARKKAGKKVKTLV